MTGPQLLANPAPDPNLHAATALTARTPSRSYAPGSPESQTVGAALAQLLAGDIDVPNIIGNREVRTGRLAPVVLPHEYATVIGHVHQGGAEHADAAVAAALEARWWGRLSARERSAPFLRAVELLADGPWRDRLVAAAMLELSKTHKQADGDAACETIDLIRANITNMAAMTGVQPESPAGVHNHMEYRPLEGFVFAVSPFNYASMNNLAFGPALLGNTVVWKPAESGSLSAHLILQLFLEAGLPPGVVNLVHGDGPEIGRSVLTHPDLSAVHFTGSTETFQHLWRTVGENVTRYRNYPRVVGETGGKGFILAHPSADLDALARACVVGAFDYQGQKCSAASRLYVPRSAWPQLQQRLVELTRTVTIGDPTQPGTFMGAVINARQHAKHAAAVDRACAEGIVVTGGHTDNTSGWFVDPTILQVEDPRSTFMTQELFAPILTAYPYDDNNWNDTLRLVDESTPYGLTGAIFADDDQVLQEAAAALRYTAGNLALNDKPTDATVGQQPFGGARASGTNDKAGTVWNLIRFASPRAIKHKMVTTTGAVSQ